MSDNDYRLRTGDVVRHVPSGEDWEVLYADYESGYMSWIGWPPGRARIADCELVRKCTDEQHARDVDLVLDGGHDPAVKARVARLAGRAT